MKRNEGQPWFRAGQNTWYVWHDGRQRSLKVRGEANEREAVKAWHRLMAGESPTKPSERPKSVPKPVEPSQAEVSVQAVVDGFLADVSDRAKPHTVEVYRYLLAGFAERFGKRSASDVKPHEAEAFVRRPTWGPTTRADCLGTVMSAFRWAVRVGLIPSNPLNGIQKPRRLSRGAKAVVSEDVHRQFLEAANPALADVLTLLWETGARPSEVFRMTADDIDFNNSVAVLTEHKTDHTGKPRLIVLSPVAVVILRRLAGQCPNGPLVRKLLGKPWDADALGTMLRVIAKRIGVKAIAYGYRHSFATDALAKGVPDATVAALLGHTGTAMLHKHYSHLTSRADVLRQAAALVR